MSDKPVTALTDVETLEVSLVKRGANQKRIAIAKTEEPMPKTMEQILKEALEMPLEEEDQIDEKLSKEGLSPEAAGAVKAALRALEAFKDELPDMPKVLEMLSGLLGIEAAPESEVKAEDEAAAPELDEMKKKLDELWKSNAEQTELLKKSEERAVAAELAKAEVESTLQAERDAKEFAELVEHCTKSFPFVLGSAEDKAKTLKVLRGASPDQANVIEASWKTANDQIASSQILKSLGTESAPSAALSASQKMDARIAEVRAAKPSMSREQALALVLKTDKSLFADYAAERAQEN